MAEACRKYLSKQEIIDHADEVFQYINSLEDEIELLRREQQSKEAEDGR